MRKYLNDKYVRLQLEEIVRDLIAVEKMLQEALPYLENIQREDPDPDITKLTRDISAYQFYRHATLS